MTSRTAWISATLALALALAGCVSLTADPRALISGPDGVQVRTLPCDAAIDVARKWFPPTPSGPALDPASIRLLTWNIHKEGDSGWDADLTRFAQASDLVLLQEVTLIDPLTDILRGAGLQWVMASSFIYKDADIGVVTAARAPTVAHCTQRVTEPLIRLPKSSVVTWLPLRGSRKLLAVANVHSINFALTLGAYEAQFAGVEEALSQHDGPVILAGDLNTWTDEREAALQRVAQKLGLTEIPVKSGRSRFMGREVDHILVRGLAVESAGAIEVESSDHHPVSAVLRVTPSGD
jgi:endonuclease/exonuclease/phosphatase (EEP) superfamily protein YafD